MQMKDKIEGYGFDQLAEIPNNVGPSILTHITAPGKHTDGATDNPLTLEEIAKVLVADDQLREWVFEILYTIFETHGIGAEREQCLLCMYSLSRYVGELQKVPTPEQPENNPLLAQIREHTQTRVKEVRFF